MNPEPPVENPRNDPPAGTAGPVPPATPPSTGTVPETGNDNDFQAAHIYGSNLTQAGGNIYQIQQATIQFVSDQSRPVLQTYKEDEAFKQLPERPPTNAELQKKVDYWFQYDLKTDSEKMFAITLSMFNGLKYPDFRDIYEIVLHVMDIEEEEKKEKEKPFSRFAVADDDLVTKVKARITRSETGLEEIINFEDDHYPAAIFDLMRRRFRNILLDLLLALKQVVEKHRYWEIRFNAALAVAEIGKLGFYHVRQEVLEPWAGDKRAYVRAAVGYPLTRLAEDERTRPGVENLLADWTDPNWEKSGETWRYRWAAASTYKQIGLIEADWAKEWTYRGLKKVAGFDDIRLADSVIHSLTVLSLMGQLTKILDTLKAWIEQGSAGSEDEKAPQVRCLVGILAFMVLSEVHIELATEEKEETGKLGIQVKNLFELVCQGEVERNENWHLVVAVGVRAFEYRLANAFFDLIARWTEYAAENSAIQNTVRNLLAEVFVEVPTSRREHILNRLNRWEQQTKNKRLAEMATSAKVKIKERVLQEPASAAPKRIVFGN